MQDEEIELTGNLFGTALKINGYFCEQKFRNECSVDWLC